MEKKPKIKNKGLLNVTKKRHLIEALPKGHLVHTSNIPCSMDRTSLTIEIPKDISINVITGKEQQPSGGFEISEKDFKREYDNEMRANYKSQYIPHTGNSTQAKKMQGQLKNLYKKLKTVDNLDITKFIKFCVHEWKYMCNNGLSFLEQHSKSSLPVSPQIGIILKFTDKFVEAYRATEKIETVYGDAVGFRAKELQKMGYLAEDALKRAVLESEVAKERAATIKDQVEAIERKYELEMARMRVEQDAQLTAMKNELRKAKEEAEKVKYSDIFNFSLNNMVGPSFESGPT